MRIRVQQYLAFAARLRANVFAPDYRGFADSTGTLSEAGVVLARRWDWLRVRGAGTGCALGTGVAVQFASALEVEADAGDKKTESGVAGWVYLAPPAVRERPRGMCSSPRSAN
ncbi:hypothetical protein EDB92DRAFT_1947298 [Lactarius akahatsu]|uniref:Uncharacterized protein n=1 Tax=Lactarius akahatsu TaxID=416441 RepID=A0AAD4LDC2_9AGAM|nr:hypothetical protein EDB92DRAFT_1947298 [Lactarius akahatsu]